MKKILIAAAIGAAIPLAGCETVRDTTPWSETMKDEKALYVAEAAFAGISMALETAVDEGYLVGAQAQTAKTYYGRAYQALVTARSAQAAGDAESMTAQSAEVLNLVGEIQRLVQAARG